MSNPTDTNQASEYPPYACSCCGATNGDMFLDYIEHNDTTLTYAEVKELCDEFDSYRAKWHRHNKEVSHAVRSAKKRPRAVRRQPNDQL